MTFKCKAWLSVLTLALMNLVACPLTAMEGKKPDTLSHFGTVWVSVPRNTTATARYDTKDKLTNVMKDKLPGAMVVLTTAAALTAAAKAGTKLLRYLPKR